MLKFNSLLLFSEAPQKLVDFYKMVLDRQPEWREEEYTGFVDGNVILVIGPHGKVHGKNQNPERIIFNLATDNVQGEFARMKKLGVQVIAEPYEMGKDSNFWIATLADPDGNYFQIISPPKM